MDPLPRGRRPLTHLPARAGLARALPPEAFNPFSRHGQPAVERAGKMEQLERMYRPPLEICFAGDFESAVRQAERQQRPLLVNVQDETDFACQLLNRDTWRHDGLKRFVAEHFVFWQPSAASPHGRYYVQFYPVALYPHIAVIDAASRFRELVLEGPITADQLQARLQEYLRGRSGGAAVPGAPEASETAETAPTAELDRMSSMDLAERQQLERAIAESLREQEGEEELLEESEEPQPRKRDAEEEEAPEHFSPPKRRKQNGAADEASAEPAASGRPPDTTLRVRDGSGRTQTVRVHSGDTLARLAWVVARDFGLPGPEGFDLTTVMPKVRADGLISTVFTRVCSGVRDGAAARLAGVRARPGRQHAGAAAARRTQKELIIWCISAAR